MKKILLSVFTMLIGGFLLAKNFSVSGRVWDLQTQAPVINLVIELERIDYRIKTDSLGAFSFTNLYPGKYKLVFKSLLYERKSIPLEITDTSLSFDTIWLTPFVYQIGEIEIQSQQSQFGMDRLRSVSGTAIYDGKKNEVIVLSRMDVNMSTNASRQIFAKVPGINIWESDAAGLQIGIATRGLDPNRTSNFNTRQNGYDMSADALGYPDSYYVPPAEAVNRIEVIRGAASLQYGPQFGGMLNYQLHTAPVDKAIEWTSYTTYGAYKLVNTFNSVGGTLKRFSYYGYYQYKQGESFRPNGQYHLHNAHAGLGYNILPGLKANLEYTFSDYLAKQPGGLTDAQFNNNPNESLRNRNWFATRWNILALTLDYKISSFHHVNIRTWGFIGQRNAVGYLGPANRADDEGRNRDLLTDRYRNIGAEARYVWKYYMGNSLSTLLVGARIYSGQTVKQQGFADNSKSARFSFAADSLMSSDYMFPGFNAALFAENVFNVANKVKITPGIRYEHIDTKASGFYRPVINEEVVQTRTDEQRSFSRNFVLLGLGISAPVWKQTEIYSNISQNYRGITFTDMRVIRTGQIVDPDLKDETGFNVDLGYRGTINEWFNFDISAYWLQYNNRIGPIQQVDSLFNVYRFTTNVGTTRSIGVEWFTEADLFTAFNIQERAGNLNVFVSAGYTNAIYIKSNFTRVIGNSLEFAPPVTVRGGITYRYKKFSSTIQCAYTASQFTEATNTTFTANAVNGEIPAYYVLDFSAQYAFKCVKLMAGINNLSNNRYFTRRAVSYPGPGIIPAEPLTFYITLGIRLNEKVKKLNWNTF